MGTTVQAERTAWYLDVSLLVGYVWADDPRATACAVVTGTAPAVQEKIAISLAQQYWDARKDFQFGTETGTINECIERAMKPMTHPVILADSGTILPAVVPATALRFLRHCCATRCRIPSSRALPIGQPRTHATAQELERLPLSIGTTLDPLGDKPVKVPAKVVFLLSAPNPRQREAVVQIDGVTLVLTSVRRPYHDIVDFTRLGLQPTSYKLIVAKSGYLSPELAPLANPSLMALSDGAINQDIVHLPANRYHPPSYPLVADLKFAPRAVRSARSRT